MEKIIVDTEKSKVIYDEEKSSYIKYFYPEKNKKIKFLLKLRKYPGENCKYISEIFLKNNIKVAEIIKYTKYSLETKEVKGDNLTDELIKADDFRKKILIEKYVELVTKIINLGIYFGDFHFGNFILCNEELYVIDLEDYRKDVLSKYRKKSLLKRLKRYLFKLTEVYKEEIYDGELIFNEILKKLK